MFVRNVYCANLDFFFGKKFFCSCGSSYVCSKDCLLEKRSLKFAACYLAAASRVQTLSQLQSENQILSPFKASATY